jgi:hypothetical protein
MVEALTLASHLAAIPGLVLPILHFGGPTAAATIIAATPLPDCSCLHSDGYSHSPVTTIVHYSVALRQPADLA